MQLGKNFLKDVFINMLTGLAYGAEKWVSRKMCQTKAPQKDVPNETSQKDVPG